MYAIKEDAKKINGVELQTFSREIQNARTEIEVESGTTGFKDGREWPGCRHRDRVLRR